MYGTLTNDIPAVEHTEFTRVGVNVAVRTTNRLWFSVVAFGRTVGDGSFLWNTVADWNFEDVTTVEKSSS